MGMDASGFTPKRQSEIWDEIKEDMEAQVGPGLVMTSDEPLGQVAGVFSDHLADIWSAMQAVYDAMNRNNAEGTVLDNLVSLIGVIRQDATKSTGPVKATGTNGTVITTGSVVRVAGGESFEVTADQTIAAGVATLQVEAQEYGDITVTGQQDLQIVTPISGWDTAEVEAGEEITGGAEIESDSDLRIRAELSVAGISAGTDASIRAAVLEVDNVVASIVVSNRSDAVWNGIDPHAFHTFVYPQSGVTGEDVAEKIYEHMPAGIEAFGTVGYTVTDSEGYSQSVYFSWATEVSLQVDIDLTTTSDYPGNSYVQAAIQEYLDTLSIGDDVLYHKVYEAVASIEGITSVDVLLLNSGTSNITIDLYTGKIVDQTPTYIFA